MENPPSTLSQLLPLLPAVAMVAVFGFFFLRHARRYPSIDIQASPPMSPIGIDARQVRRHGLKMMMFGAAVFAVILLVVYWLTAHGHSVHFALIPAALPFAYFCVGFIEAVTGAPYRQLANRWMSLAGWQRGVIGTFIVVAALVLILCGVTFVVMMFT